MGAGHGNLISMNQAVTPVSYRQSEYFEHTMQELVVSCIHAYVHICRNAAANKQRSACDPTHCSWQWQRSIQMASQHARHPSTALCAARSRMEQYKQPQACLGEISGWTQCPPICAGP